MSGMRRTARGDREAAVQVRCSAAADRRIRTGEWRLRNGWDGRRIVTGFVKDSGERGIVADQGLF